MWEVCGIFEVIWKYGGVLTSWCLRYVSTFLSVDFLVIYDATDTDYLIVTHRCYLGNPASTKSKSWSKNNWKRRLNNLWLGRFFVKGYIVCLFFYWNEFNWSMPVTKLRHFQEGITFTDNTVPAVPVLFYFYKWILAPPLWYIYFIAVSRRLKLSHWPNCSVIETIFRWSR